MTRTLCVKYGGKTIRQEFVGDQPVAMAIETIRPGQTIYVVQLGEIQLISTKPSGVVIDSARWLDQGKVS